MMDGFSCAPRESATRLSSGIPGAGLFPFDLRRQPGPRPLRICLGFEEGHVLHRFVGGDVFDVAEPDAGAVGIPELRRREPGLLPMRPTAFGPPTLLLVTTVVDELPPFS